MSLSAVNREMHSAKQMLRDDNTAIPEICVFSTQRALSKSTFARKHPFPLRKATFPAKSIVPAQTGGGEDQQERAEIDGGSGERDAGQGAGTVLDADWCSAAQSQSLQGQASNYRFDSNNTGLELVWTVEQRMCERNGQQYMFTVESH